MARTINRRTSFYANSSARYVHEDRRKFNEGDEQRRTRFKEPRRNAKPAPRVRYSDETVPKH
jgi:hypothetical protein